MIESPLFYLPKRTRFPSNSLSRYKGERSVNLKLNPLNFSKDASRKPKDKNLTYSLSVPSQSPIKTEVISIVDNDLDQKEASLFRNSPIRLVQSPSNQSPNRNSESPNNRNKPMGIRNYLDYLGSNSLNDLTNFRMKIEPAARMHTIENDSHFSQHWLHDFFPQEVKKLPALVSEKKRSNTLNNVDIDNSSPLQAKIGQKVSLQKILKEEKGSFERPKRQSINKRSIQFITKTEPESLVSNARKLAEEISEYYKYYQEHAMRSKKMQESMTEFLKLQGVLDVFIGKTEKNLPLQTKIFQHMTHKVQEKSSLIKVRPAHQEPSSFHSSNNSPEKVQTKLEVILVRFHAFQKVHEKLQDLNIEFKLQELKGLETKLLQAHKDFNSQKETTLKMIVKNNPKKHKELKLQCEATEKLIPIYKEINHECKKNLDDYFQEENVKSPAKETKTVNKALNKVMRNWQLSLLNPSLIN